MDFALKMMFICAFTKVAFAGEEVKCSCGVFKSPTPDKTTENPIMKTDVKTLGNQPPKNPNFSIKCEAGGKEACSQTCRLLAEAAKDKGPKLLCETVGTTSEPITPLVYSKSCGEAEWVNTGLSTNVKICCNKKAVIPCTSG